VPETTTIQIRIETWQALNGQKKPGDTFDDVIQDLLRDDTEYSTIATTELQATQIAPESNPETIQVPDDAPDRINRDDARAAIEAAVDCIESNGGATMREIVLEVMPDHDLGYDSTAAVEKIENGERYRGAWYRKVVRPGLEMHENIEKPAPHESEWKYVA